MLLRDLLDLDAALLAHHEDDALRGAIEDEAEIQLAIDSETFLDQQPRDLLAAGPRLIRHERLANQLAGNLLGLVGRLRQLDAAGLAAAAGMDLRLDHGHAAAEPPCDVGNFLRGEGHLTARNRNAVFGKDCFGLVLVDLHKRTSLSHGAWGPVARASCTGTIQARGTGH